MRYAIHSIGVLLTLAFDTLFSLLPTPFMVLDHDMRYVEMNDAYLDVTGRARDELLGKNIFEAFPEIGERRAILFNSLAKALNGQVDRLHNLPYSIPDSTAESGFKLSYWNAVHTPLRNEQGEVTHVIQQTQNVTEQYEAEQRNKVLTAELDHRVKNILAIVSTIGRRTARDSVSIDEFLKTFDARLQAMARTHTMLAQGKWDGTSLQTLFETELFPYGVERQITLNGSLIMLNANEAQSLSLAIHELATNASKYGALRAEDGHLTISWQMLDNGGFHITWDETVPQGITMPAHKSFGSMIIDEITPKQLGAEVTRTFTPHGLAFTLTKPGKAAINAA